MVPPRTPPCQRPLDPFAKKPSLLCLRTSLWQSGSRRAKPGSADELGRTRGATCPCSRKERESSPVPRSLRLGGTQLTADCELPGFSAARGRLGGFDETSALSSGEAPPGLLEEAAQRLAFDAVGRQPRSCRRSTRSRRRARGAACGRRSPSVPRARPGRRARFRTSGTRRAPPPVLARRPRGNPRSGGAPRLAPTLPPTLARLLDGSR